MVDPRTKAIADERRKRGGPGLGEYAAWLLALLIIAFILLTHKPQQLPKQKQNPVGCTYIKEDTLIPPPSMELP